MKKTSWNTLASQRTLLMKSLVKNYAAIHEIKPVLTLNKLIYVGFTVLKLSKWLMYGFHCSFVEKHFDAELLFTEIDSLTYKIKSNDVYKELFVNQRHLFDLSNYPQDSKFFDEANKKVLGKMKDEFGGKIVVEFVRLKWKMYLMVKIVIQQKELVLKLNLVNSKMFYLTKNNEGQNEKNSK